MNSSSKPAIRKKICARAAGALLVVLTCGGVPAAGNEILQLRVEFHPASGIKDPEAKGLRVSARRLTGEGSDFLAAGPALDLPNGVWSLEARSGDWITPRPLEIRVRRESREAELPLRLVPSCALTGAGIAGEWLKVPEEQAEILSLDYGSVFREQPSAGGVTRIPAGAFVVSRKKGDRRIAVSAPLTCAPGKSLPLPFPPVPSAGDWTLYLQLTPAVAVEPAPSALVASPAGKAAPRTEAAGAEVSGPAEPAIVFLQAETKVVPPGASALRGKSQVAIFYGLPAERELELRVLHSASLTHEDEVVGASGNVVSEELELLPRKRYELDLDYRPARDHERADLVLKYCGFSPGSYDCREFARRRLVEGQAVHSFEGLDRGQYRLTAEIDGFVLEGLGRGMGEQAAKLVEYDSRPMTPDSYAIRESHIFGNILSEGVAIPGRIVLQSASRESWPALEFPTGEDLLFHIYYFGADETVYTMARDEKSKRSKEQIPRAIPIDYRLAVCSEAGFCRHLNLHSRIRGEGRMDLEIGAQAAAQLTILDEDTAKPVEAKILLEAESRALIFEDGEQRWVEPAGAERQAFRTDERGRAEIPLSADKTTTISVRAEGYEPYREEVQGVLGKFLRRTIRLKPMASLTSGHRLVFADGRPVERAFLLPIEGTGQRRVDCHRITDRNGFAKFSEICRRSAASILVLHPRAAIALLDAGAWAEGQGETVLAAAPDPPLRLKLTRAGEPLPGATVALQYPDFALEINDLLAERLAGHQLFYQTNQVGELVLQGVDPQASPILRIDGKLFPVLPASRTQEIALD